MKNKLFILISILALSCNNDESNTQNQTDKTALNLVTGVNFRETSDESEIPMQLGNPNVLVNNKFILFPNPVKELAYLSAQENITDVWLVPANPEKIHQDVNFNSILNTNLYREDSIIMRSNFSLNGQSSNSITLNVAALQAGYYKIFVKIDGEIYCDNLYKYENQRGNEEQFTEILNFWN